MKVAIPKEVKNNEFRVAITPAGVHDLVAHGHERHGADRRGARVVDHRCGVRGGRGHHRRGCREHLGSAPTCCSRSRSRSRASTATSATTCVLFTYLHLAAAARSPTSCSSRQVTAIAYETVQLPARALPLLAPMSEVAGRLAPIVGANAMLKPSGGPGLLVPGVPGTDAAKVVVLGGGVAGSNAVADRGRTRRRRHRARHEPAAAARDSTLTIAGRVHTIASNGFEIERALLDADLVIGSVLVPGAKAPKLVSNDLVSRMKRGQRARRHRRRPGRLLRRLPPDHARRPDVHGARIAVLLRREHARRRAEHVDLRAHQRDPAVRAGDREPRLEGRAARRPGPGARPQHPRRARHATRRCDRALAHADRVGDGSRPNRLQHRTQRRCRLGTEPRRHRSAPRSAAAVHGAR